MGGWLFFERARLELHRIWQPMDGCICVRWTLRGVPRFLGPVMEHGGMHLDGISEYKLDSEGLIYQHRLDNLDFDSGLRLSLAQEVLARIQSNACPPGLRGALRGRGTPTCTTWTRRNPHPTSSPQRRPSPPPKASQPEKTAAPPLAAPS